MPADRFLHRRAGRSDKVSSLTDLEYRVWTQYILSADDFGIMPMAAAVLQSDNYHLANRPAKQLLRSLTLLVTVGLLRSFEHQKKTYLYQHDWQDWQKIGWAAKTINPQPPIDTLTDKTQELFKIFPGGCKVPKKFSESSPEVLPPTREMANGLRVQADGVGEIQEGEFHRFQLAYPSSRRKGGYLVETAFFDARRKVSLADLLAAVENHAASEQWQTPKLIPGMDTWLKEERWTQRLEPPKLAGTTEKTAGNADALRRFVERHNAAN